MFADYTLLGWTVTVLWGFFLLFVWIALAFWPARVAARKGHSFLGYFLFSIFFFPLALLVAYLTSDNSARLNPA
jgi:accessory gene regulator protein AgrB